MLLKNNFISVDWGTTNLRIRLVSNDKFKIIKEKDYDLGLKKINLIWKKYADKKQTRQEFIFKKLMELVDDFKINGENIPLVLISGMASSSIGIEELQYTSLPVDLENPSIAIKEYELNGSSINLISGVKTTKDVIRGEETQLIGLYQSFIKNKNVLVVIPGTHSKHIYCQNGSFIDFETYLTGELFDTITSYTILKESVRKNDFNEKNLSSFISGLEIMKKGNRLTKVLFDIRVNNLFKTSTNDENYYFLSGLIIGDELLGIKKEKIDSIIIYGAEQISKLYFTALNYLNVVNEIISVPYEKVGYIEAFGQHKIYKCNN